MQLASNPLFIEDLAGNSNETKRGATAQRRIRVKNLGEKIAEIDIWIAATDNKSEPLLHWCTFSEQNPLKIDAKSFKEVTLNFQIPQQAILDVYNYEILIEAATQYPGKIFRRPQQLRILPSDQDAEWGNEPGFTIIQPITHSASPFSLALGEQLEVKVQVENRSKRVDRFYLNCPELSLDWYSVRYPEIGLNIPGLVKETDGLELNPGSTGEITLVLHPPQYTRAGNYFPTIRLISSNKEELVLLDVVYLLIQPNDGLDVQMSPLSCKVPAEAGHFEIELTNQGNIQREITVSAKDREELFSYTAQPKVLQISPGQKRIVALKVKPQKWWRRHWRGKSLPLTFDIELENTNVGGQDSLTLALPKNLPQGTLVWESHPWWQLWLLVLSALGIVGILALAIWWNLLREKIPPPPNPKVLQFETTSLKYQEGKDAAIRLNWKVSHLKRLEKVTITRLENNVEAERKNYFFQSGIPQELKIRKDNKNGFCEITQAENSNPLSEKEKQGAPEATSRKTGLFSLPFFNNTNSKKDTLNCRGIITTAQKAGNYTFKIEAFSKTNPEQPSSEQKTDTISIQPVTPLPLPKILDFSSNQPSYEEVNPDLPPMKSLPGALASAPILLNWEISSPSHIKELRIVGKAPDGSISSLERSYSMLDDTLPSQLRKFCEPTEKLNLKQNLVCKNVPIDDARKPGDYIFTLTVVPQDGKEENAIVLQTPTIKIKPLPAPQVTDFSPVKPIYQETLATKPANIKTKQDVSAPPIHLNWNIAHPAQIKELKIVGLGADGSMSSQLQHYVMAGTNLPLQLKNLCTITAKNLSCRNVPTDVAVAGNYTFKMMIIPRLVQTETEIIKTTEIVKIQPLPATPVNIISFRVNGEEVRRKPKRTFAISKKRTDADMTVSWEVAEGEDIKVELLPAPGVVSAKGSLKKFPLSKAFSTETMTLKVTNKAGEQTTQTVMIETVESKLPSQSQPFSFGSSFDRTASPSDSSTPDSPTPSNTPDQLAPIEVSPLTH